MTKYTEAELNEFSKKHLVRVLLEQQEQFARMNENMELLIEQFRIMQNNRFGRKTECLDQFPGQLSCFNEAEAACDPDADEVFSVFPEADELFEGFCEDEEPWFDSILSVPEFSDFEALSRCPEPSSAPST